MRRLRQQTFPGGSDERTMFQVASLLDNRIIGMEENAMNEILTLEVRKVIHFYVLERDTQ